MRCKCSWLLIALPAAFAACGGDPPALDVADGGADGDADGDSDADTDTDTDADSDTSASSFTIMMYEDADNNLEEVLMEDFNEAEASDIPDNVNVIVLFDRAEGYSTADGDWTGAKLFRLEHDPDLAVFNSPRLADPDFLGLTADSEDGEEVDMGSAATLEGFIDFCQQNFPADQYILHISDHGDGWKALEPMVPTAPALFKGMCSDDSSGNHLTISHDLPAAIEGKGLAAISFDACLLGTVEVAWAVKDHADFMSASVMSVPGTGWQYTDTLNRWFEDMTAVNWVVASVEEFEAFYGNQGSVGFTAVDLGEMDAFLDPLSAFLVAAEGVDVETLKEAKSAAATPQWMGWDGMVDFRDLMTQCRTPVGEAVTDALIEAFDAAILASWYSSDLPKVNGLSIYAPRSMWGYGGYDADYDGTPFAIDTAWEDFIIPLVE